MAEKTEQPKQPQSKFVDCQNCSGKGLVDADTVCPECDGSGKVLSK